MLIDDNVRAGMTPSEARRAALLRFGGVENTREAYRDRLTLPRVEHVVRDVRIAVRQLRRAPAFSLTAILVLTVGIGASAAIFAFVDAALIKPLPYREPARLVGLFESTPLGTRFHLSYPDYLDWRRDTRAFSALDAYEPHAFRLGSPDGAAQIDGVRISAAFLRTLGVTPMLGRDFREGEDLPDAAPVALLTHGMWQARFGGREDILGRTLLLDDKPHTIVGVLPRAFHFAPAGSAEVWTSLQPRNPDERGSHDLSGLARLKDGVTTRAAAADLTAVAARLAARYPDSNRGRGATMVPLAELIVGDARPVLLTLLAGAGLLLLIAAVNVASLLLVRSETRRREIALRAALGASRARLWSQFAAESIVLVAIATALAWLAASAALHALVRAIPAARASSMPYLQDLGLNGRVAIFMAIVAIVMTAAVAVTPALRLSAGEMRDGLTEAGRGASGTAWRRLGVHLVAVELATAMILLVAAGLLGQSFVRLMRVDTGLQADQLSTLLVTGMRAAYPDNARLVAATRRLLDRLASLPGVTSAGLANDLPLGDGGGTSPLSVIGSPRMDAAHGGTLEHDAQEVNVRWVSAQYFTTLRARLIRGRYFSADDDASRQRVAIVNRALARRMFGNTDPIGRRVSYAGPDAALEIVGVVGDIKEGPLDQATQPALYAPFDQAPGGRLFLVVRAAHDATSLLTAMQAVVREIDPRLAMSRQGTMRERIDGSMSAYFRRAAAWLVGGFALAALLLGTIGLYGVVTYSVGQRRREIGVRVALGASRGAVYRMILGEAGRVILVGLGLGLAGSIAMAGLLRGLLFGIDAWDAPTMIGVALLLAGAALIGSFLPARRAASVSPLEALRTS
jgi:predicted permease